LLADEGNASSFQELLDTTPWDKYGTVKNPKCANCMAHCGYEATAVEDTLSHPLKALWASIRGPKTSGDMVAESNSPAKVDKPSIRDIPVKIES
jgi:hypothetical protein